jgi:aminopeptidase N
VSGTPPVVDPYVPERGNEGYEVTCYELDLDYAIGSNLLHGRARITLRPVEPLARFELDLVGLRVSKVAVSGRSARWRQRAGKLHVTPGAALAEGREVLVDVRYSGNPRPTGSTWGPVGWEELTDGVLVAAQPSGACTWFPCNEVAWQKAPFRISITSGSAYRAVANGALRSRRVHGSTTTWVYEQVEPAAPYLMTLHLGRYEEHRLAEGPVPVRAYLAPEHRRAFEVAFARQVRMVDVLSECFGPYPFAAGYTVVLCPEPLELPLEAQGQAIFGTNHLDGRHERLIAHELAHQWFGNSLTAATWSDIWLHEGFACYAEWIWSERSGGLSADEHARTHHGRLAGLPQDLVLTDPGPGHMFDDRVYKRGALTLHALRLALGDGPFFDLLRRWATTHQHAAVTTPGFEAMATEAAGAAGAGPLEPLLDSWLRRGPLPDLG